MSAEYPVLASLCFSLVLGSGVGVVTPDVGAGVVEVEGDCTGTGVEIVGLGTGEESLHGSIPSKYAKAYNPC